MAIVVQNENLTELNPVSRLDNALTIHDIEEKILNIFEDEKKQDTPVFLYIKPGTAQKIAYFLSSTINRSVGIGIAGGSASGKSTIAFDIIERIKNFERKHELSNLITRVDTDDYYYDKSEDVKKAGGFDNFVKNYDLDIPDAFELDLLNRHISELKYGNKVLTPKYFMDGTARRQDDYAVANPAKIIISEGLFTLTEKLADVFDFKIYVDVSAQVQKTRWYQRAEERGLGDAADGIYNNAMQKAQIYIEPSAKEADIILNGEASREKYKIFTSKILDIIEEQLLKN